MRRLKNSVPVIVGIVLAAFVAIALVIGVSSYYSETTHTNCRVDDKDRTVVMNDGNRETEARVYTENCGVFVVDDSLVKRKFSSADTFGGIKKGQTYDFTTIGWRVPLMSMFPNIIEAK